MGILEMDTRNIDNRTRKLMTMKALHRRDDIERLYVTGKEGGRVLTSILDCVDGAIQALEAYINKKKERLITTAIDSNNRRKKKERKKNRNVNKKNYMR